MTPEPAGVCDMCTREKNELAAEHTTQVIKPLVGRLRTAGAGLVLYSLRGAPHAITERMYRTFGRAPPTPSQRMAAEAELAAAHAAFAYAGHAPVPRLRMAAIVYHKGCTLCAWCRMVPLLRCLP